MKNYQAREIRNVAVIGHGGEGKTTLSEYMLLITGIIDRLGGVLDYDPEEQKRELSIGSSMCPIEWRGIKLNVIDTPGYFDFVGETVGALSVADAALIVMGATSGLSVGTQKAFRQTQKGQVPRMVVVNGMDKDNADYEHCVQELAARYGNSIAPIMFPIIENEKFVGVVSVVDDKAWRFEGKTAKECPVPDGLSEAMDTMRNLVIESAASANDELMQKFFDHGELTHDEMMRGLREGIQSGQVVPVTCASAYNGYGVTTIMDLIVELFPTAVDKGDKMGTNPKTQAAESRACDEAAPFSAQVFKTLADPFVGKLSLIRIYSGKLTSEMSLYNPTTQKNEKAGNISTMRGKKLIALDCLLAGDIGVLSKLQYTSTGDTLCDGAKPIQYPAIDFPKPSISMAVTAKNSKEEDKVVSGLYRLQEEDPTIAVTKSITAETILSGQGELHLKVITRKLKQKFGVECTLSDPEVPYRETLRGSVKAEGRHKKQSGGHGQFGHIWVEFGPGESDEFEFVDKVVGGSVPRQFIPAVEKGLRENLGRGILAGYPIVGVRATLYDGSSHPVDSSEMAFKTAARMAMKRMPEASPALLEPIYHIEVVVPDEYMGDIIGDMNRRRGRILGMNKVEDGQQVVAEAPLSEMFKYATDLRSMTQARGSFSMQFERYEDVPPTIAQKIIENAKIEEDEA